MRASITTNPLPAVRNARSSTRHWRRRRVSPRSSRCSVPSTRVVEPHGWSGSRPLLTCTFSTSAVSGRRARVHRWRSIQVSALGRGAGLVRSTLPTQACTASTTHRRCTPIDRPSSSTSAARPHFRPSRSSIAPCQIRSSAIVLSGWRPNSTIAWSDRRTAVGRASVEFSAHLHDVSASGRGARGTRRRAQPVLRLVPRRVRSALGSLEENARKVLSGARSLLSGRILA